MPMLPLKVQIIDVLRRKIASANLARVGSVRIVLELGQVLGRIVFQIGTFAQILFSFFSSILDLFGMQFPNINVQGTPSWLNCSIVEMFVVGHWLFANVAHAFSAFWTIHFVAAFGFHERCLTMVAIPDQGFGHFFLELDAVFSFLVFLHFFAT